MEMINIFIFHDQKILATVRENYLGFQSAAFTFVVLPSLDSSVLDLSFEDRGVVFFMFSLYLNIKCFFLLRNNSRGTRASQFPIGCRFRHCLAWHFLWGL